MKFGAIETGRTTQVVASLGENWVNVSEAWRNYEREVEGRSDVQMLQDVECLIRHDLMTRSFYRRITEFVQRNGRLETYRLTQPPSFTLPLRPGKIIAMGRNYKAHAQEMGNDVPDEPIFFAKAISALTAHETPIIIKDWYGTVNYEGELGVIIGKRIKDASTSEAREAISGYTLVNDVTARAMQLKDFEKSHPWFRSKSMDTFCPMGPTVVLRDALEWPLTVTLELRLNGQVRQKSNTDKFIFPLDEAIAYISKYMTFEPGDLIATGTPEGIGALSDGDVVEVAIDEVGVLRNTVRRAP